MASNTAHKVYDAVAPKLGVPMLHIGDATADRLVADGRNRVALLGTRFTMTEPHIRSRGSKRAGSRSCRSMKPWVARGRPDHLRGARRRPRRPRQPAQAQDPDHRARQAEGSGGGPRLHRAGACSRRPRQRDPGLRHHRDPCPRRGRMDACRGRAGEGGGLAVIARSRTATRQSRPRQLDCFARSQ